MTMIDLQESNPNEVDALYSSGIGRVVIERTPAYQIALGRVINMGLSKEEAEALIKE